MLRVCVCVCWVVLLRATNCKSQVNWHTQLGGDRGCRRRRGHRRGWSDTRYDTRRAGRGKVGEGALCRRIVQTDARKQVHHTRTLKQLSTSSHKQNCKGPPSTRRPALCGDDIAPFFTTNRTHAHTSCKGLGRQTATSNKASCRD